MSYRLPVLVDGRIFSLQTKGGISQMWAYILNSPNWTRQIDMWLVLYPGHERNVHLGESELTASLGIERVLRCPIPPSDNENWNLPEHAAHRSTFVRAAGAPFRAVVNTYYGENLFADCSKYIVTALDFAHEELPDLAEKPSTPAVLRQKRRAFEQAHWVTFISNASRQRFFGHYPQFDRRRTGVIYLGHNEDYPNPPKARDMVVHVGARGGYKDFGVVADGVETVLARNANARFLIMGGESEDLLIRRMKGRFPARTHFDQVPSDKVMDFAMATAFAYVSASRYEGFGIPLLNALRLATHPVVSDIPVYREIGGTRARYFPPGSPDMLAVALEQALSSQPVSTAVRRTWNDVASEYARLVLNV
jgi:glycosyltransferase involved in cell wall biosynthesis